MQRERIITHLTVLSLSLPFAAHASGKKLYSERDDLASSLQQSICQNQQTDELHRIAWKQGIYDAAIEIRMIERRDKGALSTGKLRSLAIWQMKQNYHHGFGFRKCDKDRAFMISVPSRQSLTSAKDGKSISLAKSKRSCRQLIVKHAPIEGGESRLIKLSRHGKINISALKPGIVSVSCQPRHPKWLGPILWFLIPVGLDGFPETPYKQHFAGTQDAEQQLKSWVDHVRRHEGLVPLNFSKKALKDAASQLALSKMLFHDRSVMKQVKSGLGEKDLVPLGEDRARASSPSRIAWLLWHSPSHRDLLLNKNADLAGLSVSKEAGSYFVVLMTAQSEKVTVSRK